LACKIYRFNSQNIALWNLHQKKFKKKSLTKNNKMFEKSAQCSPKKYIKTSERQEKTVTVKAMKNSLQ